MIKHFSLLAAAGATLLLAGCHVSSDKHGDSDNVSVGTPFGSMHIKTNDNTAVSGIGITIYPGATLEKKEGKDDGSADINMSFGDFHLGVKAASYTTPDSQDKVIAFYKKDLARYGEVLTCRGDATVGQPTRTSQGLTCNDKEKSHITADGMNSNDNIELRTGSEAHQHIVGVEPQGSLTKIGMVALDLPTHLGNHDKDGAE